MIAGLFWRIVTSRAGILVMAGLTLFTWHKLDRGSAVRQAVSGYVARVELETLRSERDELRRRQAAVRLANRDLHSKVRDAEAEADAAAQELEHYESTFDDTCRVDDALVERLHNR